MCFLQCASLLLLIVVTAANNKIYFSEGDNQYWSPESQSFAGNVIERVQMNNLNVDYEKNVIVKGIAQLSVKINKLLVAQTNDNENVIFSPLSITGILHLILMGSSGPTFKEISQLLDLNNEIPDLDERSQMIHEGFGRMLAVINKTAGFQPLETIKIATALFVQQDYPIRAAYKFFAELFYRSSIENVDFRKNSSLAQEYINKWVSEKTQGKINTIIDHPLPTETRVVISNALYFEAEWERHFFEGTATQKYPFYVNGRNSKATIEAYLMGNGGFFPYYKDEELGCTIVGLPYKGNLTTMYVIMPFESSRDRLFEFQSKITANDLNNLVSKTNFTDMIILFPRMKLEDTLDLDKTLKQLGVTSLFNPHQANLGVLSAGTNPQNIAPDLTKTSSIDEIRKSLDNENPGLYATEIVHKVFMDITEKGTTAAASTAVYLSKSGGRVTFKVDVPFMFFIRHDLTETILFWGSIVAPTPNYNIPQ